MSTIWIQLRQLQANRLRAGVMALLLLPLFVPATLTADDQPRGKKLALLVGVKEYNHAELPNLRFAENDVEDLAEVLRKQKFQVVVLTTALGRKDPELLPTVENIQKSLKGLLQGVTKHDLIVVGLAGHGIQPLGSDYSYFCPMNGNPTTKAGKEANDPNVVESPASLVSIDELLENLRNSGVGQKLLLVDACRNDPKVRGRRGVEQVRIQSLPPETGVLLSCSAGQFAFEHESWGKRGNGAFFSQVLAGMGGAAADETGAVTWETLAIYVRKRVPAIVQKVYGKDGGEQRPNEIKNFSGDFMPLAMGTPIGTPQPNGTLTLPPSSTPPVSPKKTPATVTIDPADPYLGKAAGNERNDNSLKLRLIWCPAGKLKKGRTDSGLPLPMNTGSKKAALDQANSQLLILESQLEQAFKSLNSKRIKRAEYDRIRKDYESQKKVVDGLKTTLALSPIPTPPRVGTSEATLAHGFWIGKYEVKQQEWATLMETRPWEGNRNVKEGPDFPASYVSWDDAISFCKKLTDQEHLGGQLPRRWKYSLPGETQWEFACRSQIEAPYSFGSDENNLQNFAWFKSNADDAQEDYPHAVGGKNANAWGLCDMHGNVAEWCLDSFSSQQRQANRSLKFVLQKAVRGGSWSSPAGDCRSADRGGQPTTTHSSKVGFRVVVVPRVDPPIGGK